MSVLEDLRAELERARAAGEPFADAWPVALIATIQGVPRGFERDCWRDALYETAGAWRSAYEGAPATLGEVACGMLAYREPGVRLARKVSAMSGA